ncbi:hypothetical protein [Lonepinella sp. MS14435]|uniref:hypothetical protein n=1 Tax=Lonepinella sp. MS14435 TaxID=3003618 RepID=UPI0036DB875F
MSLDLPLPIEQMIIKNAQHNGLSVTNYLAKLIAQDNTKSVATENPMIMRAKSIVKPTSYEQYDAVTLQRMMRDEWN